MVKKFDVIVTWPDNNDYPLWRDFIKKSRGRFEKVIVVFMKSNGVQNYKAFVKMAMEHDDILFLDSPTIGPDQDWRDVAVNCALTYSESEWVWFTEQDFFADEKLWSCLDRFVDVDDKVIGVFDGPRLHPCCIFIKREILNETSYFFGIKSGVFDHFGKLQIDLKRNGVDICHLGDDLYLHYAGLSQNFYLLSIGEQPNYKPYAFENYINQCFECGIVLDDLWVNTAQKLKL